MRNMFKRYAKKTVAEVNATNAIDFEIEKYRVWRDEAYTECDDKLFAEYVEKIAELQEIRKAMIK